MFSILQVDRDVELQARWKYCALSGEELKQPVVACELGRSAIPLLSSVCNHALHRIYNKEAVLMALLDKSSIPEVARHIRSLKDVTLLQLTVNPSFKPSSKADAYNDTHTSQYVCPVAGLEMSGRYRYCLPRETGRERKMREKRERAVRA